MSGGDTPEKSGGPTSDYCQSHNIANRPKVCITEGNIILFDRIDKGILNIG
jgi:hypothetical protein